MSKSPPDDDWDNPDLEFWNSIPSPKRTADYYLDDDHDPEFWNSTPSPKRRCLPPLPADDWDNDGMDDIIRNYSAENQAGGGFVPVAPEVVVQPEAAPPAVDQPEAAPEVDQPPPPVVQPDVPHMNFNDLFSIRKTGERKAKKFGLSMFTYEVDVAPLPFHLDNAASLLVLPELFSAIYRVCTTEFLPDDKIIITMTCKNLDLG